MLLSALANGPAAQAGTVASERKISATSGGFGGDLSPSDRFGSSAANLGDLDRDGVQDLAVGAWPTDGQGAVWILFLNADGSVKSEREIGEGSGGFGGWLDAADHFGESVGALGDVDGDGITDLAVGAPGDDDGPALDQGAVWILFLRLNGTVRAWQKISATSGGFGGTIDGGDLFGTSVASPGDLDGDGIPDLAVGASWDDEGFLAPQGAVWMLLLNSDGTVKAEQKIGDPGGGFGGDVEPYDVFGKSLAPLGDFDGDGIGDLAVGAFEDDDGGNAQGAVWIVLLNADGSVKAEQKISATEGGFTGPLDPQDRFGVSVASPGDLDGDGTADLAVGSVDDDGGTDQGALWILFLHGDGTVKAELKIAEGQGGFGGVLDPGDDLGSSVASLGDLDGDGSADLAVGAPSDDDGGPGQGAVWILFLEGASCLTLDFETEDDFLTPLVNGQHIDTEFGRLVSIGSSGENAGLAIFDSTAGGPNDPSQDRDLLVGTGNILILQTENYPPDGNDVFPRPNDDDDGGTIAFAFATPVEASWLRLIDLDGGDGAVTVISTDLSGRQRIHTVPSNWTGDLLLSQPGHRSLDLTTLAPQPGFGSVATATEDAGFDPSSVIQLDVHLDGSGGIDDLCVRPVRASATLRNGSGINPVILTAASMPVLGTTWRCELDCSAYGNGQALLVVQGWPDAGERSPFGEVLVGGPRLHREIRVYTHSSSLFTFAIPHDVSLCGLEVHVQGLCAESSAPIGPKLGRARGALSNALDLILGF